MLFEGDLGNGEGGVSLWRGKELKNVAFSIMLVLSRPAVEFRQRPSRVCRVVTISFSHYGPMSFQWLQVEGPVQTQSVVQILSLLSPQTDQASLYLAYWGHSTIPAVSSVLAGRIARLAVITSEFHQLRNQLARMLDLTLYLE